MKEWHGFLDYCDINHLPTNFVFFNSGPLLMMFQVLKWQKVDRETKKPDGLGQLNTEKQVLSKAEAFASLPTAGSSFHIRPVSPAVSASAFW